MAESGKAQGRAGTGPQHVEHVGHVVPMWILAGTLAALLVLTAITVAATRLDIGPLNVVIALVIATIKAVLVVLFFMHLAYDRPIIPVVLIATLFFVSLFIGLALFDVFHYRENVESFRQREPGNVAPTLEVKRERLKSQREADSEHP